MNANLRPVPSDVESPAAHKAAVAELDIAFSQLMNQFRLFVSRAAEATSPGMQPSTYRVLSAIHREGTSTVSALAEALLVDKSLISRSVSELEELGLIERTTDPADRRIRVLTPTPLADRRLRKARNAHESIVSNGVAAWPVHRIEELSELLHALAAGVERDRPAAD